MALTSYFNWETTLQADLNLEASTFHEATPEEEVVLLAPDYNHLHLHPPYYYYPYNYNSDENYNSFHDPSSTSSNFLYHPPHDHHHLLPYDPLISLLEDHYYYYYYHHHNYNDSKLLPCPKCQKYYFSSYDQSLMEPKPTSNIVPNDPEFCNKLEGGCGCEGSKNNVEKTSTGVSMSVSAQSKAARERRRKITEKTHKLGRLVPAASNMNTADMLHAVAKYLTYLKAQVDMLQLINTIQMQEDKALSGTKDLQALLTSPFVEEKLYLKEKCFVPKELVSALTNLQDVQSRPSILNDLNQLTGTNIEKKEQP